MTVKDLHRESMKFNDLALLAKFDNDIYKVKENFFKAFEFEKQAFILFNRSSNEEPTRSILVRSAANLAILSEEFREAEKLISIGLAGDISEEFANEFRDLLQQINFFRHLELKGIVLNTDELQLSLAGNQVGHGMIRSDEFLNRIDIIEKIAYRTADRLRKNPFADNAKSKKDNVINFEPYLSVPRAASFAVTIRFGQIPSQQVLEGMNIQSVLIDDILSNIQLINEENYLKLNENIQDETYRNNFIALAKQLAPDGDRIKLVGFTTTKNSKNITVTLTKPTNRIEPYTIPKKNKVTVIDEPVELEGVLSFADSKKSKIKLTNNENTDFEIVVPNGLLSDIVKPFFEDVVFIKGIKSGKKIILNDISKK